MILKKNVFRWGHEQTYKWGTPSCKSVSIFWSCYKFAAERNVAEQNALDEDTIFQHMSSALGAS